MLCVWKEGWSLCSVLQRQMYSGCSCQLCRCCRTARGRDHSERDWQCWVPIILPHTRSRKFWSFEKEQKQRMSILTKDHLLSSLPYRFNWRQRRQSTIHGRTWWKRSSSQVSGSGRAGTIIFITRERWRPLYRTGWLAESSSRMGTQRRSCGRTFLWTRNNQRPAFGRRDIEPREESKSLGAICHYELKWVEGNFLSCLSFHPFGLPLVVRSSVSFSLFLFLFFATSLFLFVLITPALVLLPCTLCCILLLCSFPPPNDFIFLFLLPEVFLFV